VNINFTDKEYRLLLDAVFIAEWVMTVHDTGPEQDDDPHQMLFQKIYSYAGEMGCAGLVDVETDTNRYYPSRRYEEDSGVFEWIEEYNALTFWDELIARLTERDVLNDSSPGELELMGTEEYQRRASPHEQRYATEFEQHGIDRLVIEED